MFASYLENWWNHQNLKKKQYFVNFFQVGILNFLMLLQELERSKYATQALELSKLQEETKQQEQMVKIKEYEAHIEQVK